MASMDNPCTVNEKDYRNNEKKGFSTTNPNYFSSLNFPKLLQKKTMKATEPKTLYADPTHHSEKP